MSEMMDWGASHEPGRLYPLEDEGQSNQPKDNTSQEIENLRQHLKRHEELVVECRKLVHDLSQPLTYLISTLELSELSEQVSQEDIASMIEAAREIRDQLQAFRANNLQK